jgi:carbamoyl-phosphate synthase large subunit
MEKRLLITGAGTGASNNLIRSLRAADPPFLVIGVHSDRFVLKRSTADRNYLAPPTNRAEFVPMLRGIVDAERINLVLPVSDADVSTFSKLAQWLRSRLFLPDVTTIARCNDKYKLNVFLRSRGIPVPLTYPVADLRRIGELFRRLPRGSPAWCRIRRGSGAIGAVPVRTAEQARNWIKCWAAIRGISPRVFTLSEFLPGRDFACQSIWREGALALIKTCERISYFGTGSQPGVVSSVATLAKTVNEPLVAEICTKAVRAVDPRASGVFSIDLRENARDVPCVTEINAGRLSSGTNILDLTGKYNMAVTYARLGLGEPIEFRDTYDVAKDYYMLRDLDTLPAIHHGDEFFEGIRETWAQTKVQGRQRRSHTGRKRYGHDSGTRRAPTASSHN